MNLPLPAMKPGVPGVPLPGRKPVLPPPMAISEADVLLLDNPGFWTSFRRNFASRFSDEFLDGRDLSLNFFLSSVIAKFKIAGWKGNTGIETAAGESLDVLLGEYDPQNAEQVFARVGLLMSRTLAEELLEKRVIAQVRKIPIVGDAAAGVGSTAVEVFLDGVEGSGVITAITFFSIQDALRETRRETPARPLEAVPPPHGLPLPPSKPDLDCQRVTSGPVVITSCLPSWMRGP